MISREKAAHIRSLADADGTIDPKKLVADARKPTSPLHDEFEWDVDAAAEHHWLDTARGLIRFVKITIETERRTVVAPYYVPDPDREPKSKRYIDITVARQSVNTAKAIMLAELDRVAAAIRRAQEVCDVLGLRGELDDMLADVTQLKTVTERKRETAAAKKADKKARGKVSRKPPPKRPGRQPPEARV